MKHPTFAIPLGWAERRWFYRDVNSGEIFSIEIPWDMTDMGAQSEAAVSILQSIYESDGVVGVLKILQTFAEAANAARRTPASREHAEPNAAIYDILDDALVAQWIKTLPLEARATLRSKYFTWADPEDSGIPTRPVHPALLLFLSHAVVDKILADAINPALYPRAKASICSNDKISDISLQRCGHFVSIGQFLQKYLSPAELKIVRGQGVWVQVSGRVMHLPSALLSEMVVIPGDYFWVTPPRFFEQVDAFEIQPDPVGRKISFGVGLLNSVPGLLGLSQVSASFQKAQTLVQIIHQWMSRWMPFDRFHLSRTAIVLSGMVLAVPAVWLMKELTATFHRSFKRLRSAKNPEAQSA